MFQPSLGIMIPMIRSGGFEFCWISLGKIFKVFDILELLDPSIKWWPNRMPEPHCYSLFEENLYGLVRNFGDFVPPIDFYWV